MFARVDTRSALRLCIARTPLCAASATAGGGNFGDGNRISDDASSSSLLLSLSARAWSATPRRKPTNWWKTTSKGGLVNNSSSQMPCTPGPAGISIGRTVVENWAFEHAAVAATSRISSANTSRPEVSKSTYTTTTSSTRLCAGE